MILYLLIIFIIRVMLVTNAQVLMLYNNISYFVFLLYLLNWKLGMNISFILSSRDQVWQRLHNFKYLTYLGIFIYSEGAMNILWAKNGYTVIYSLYALLFRTESQYLNWDIRRILKYIQWLDCGFKAISLHKSKATWIVHEYFAITDTQF